MSFMTKKNQPVDTETRLRLIKRNISNALYGSGNRNAKTRQFFVDAIPELLSSTWTDISNVSG